MSEYEIGKEMAALKAEVAEIREFVYILAEQEKGIKAKEQPNNEP